MQPGDKIRFLNEEGGGIITSIISSDEIQVETEDGFTMVYSRKDLVLDRRSKDYGYISDDIVKEKVQADLSEQQKRLLNKKVNHTEYLAKGQETWEVDLHIEELIDNHHNMSNAEIMQVQISRLKAFLYQAQTKGVHRMIIIHGRGEGVLKNEVWKILGTHSNYDFHDASYREYGYGATEVIVS